MIQPQADTQTGLPESFTNFRGFGEKTRSVESRHLNDSDIEIVEKISSELGEKICSRAKASDSGAFFSVNVEPVVDNFGAVAQIRILNRQKSEDAKSGGNPSIMSEHTFTRVLLKTAVARGRDAGRPQLIPLKLQLGDELLTANMTLFIGIKQNHK